MTNEDPIKTFQHDPFTSTNADRIPTVRNPLETPAGLHNVPGGHGNDVPKSQPGER